MARLPHCLWGKKERHVPTGWSWLRVPSPGFMVWGLRFWGLGIRVKGLEPNNLTSMFDG